MSLSDVQLPWKISVIYSLYYSKNITLKSILINTLKKNVLPAILENHDSPKSAYEISTPSKFSVQIM